MAKLFSHVSPGQLIASNMMNDLLDEVNSLEARVTALEALPGTQGNVAILSLQPSNTMRVGQTLAIVGRNFVSPPENNNVTVAGVRITADLFKFNSDESNLIFVIPPVPNLDTMSQPVTVQVANQNGMATAPLTLLPALVTPAGRLEVAYTVAPVMPLSDGNMRTGNNYIFTFAITAFVNVDSTYQVTPTLAGWNPQLLNDTDNNPRSGNVIPIPGGLGGVTRNVRIQVTAPASPNTGSLVLNVIETSGFGKVNPGNATIDLAVDSPPPTPENRVRVSIRSVAPAPAQIVGNSVQFKRNTAGAISFNFAFTVNGSFNLSADLRNPTGWVPAGSSPQVNPASLNVPPGAQDASVILKPGAGATNTDLIITITSGQGVNPPLNVKYSQAVSVVDS